jgi:hypothetical protein
MVQRAVTNGAKVLLVPENQFWSDRAAWIIGPSGHVGLLPLALRKQRHNNVRSDGRKLCLVKMKLKLSINN